MSKKTFRKYYESVGFSEEQAKLFVEEMSELSSDGEREARKKAKQRQKSTRARGPDKRKRKARADAGKLRKRPTATSAPADFAGPSFREDSPPSISASYDCYNISESSSQATSDSETETKQPTLSRHARRREALEQQWDDVRSPLFERYIVGKRASKPAPQFVHSNTCGSCEDLMEKEMDIQLVSLDGVTDSIIDMRFCQHVCHPDPIDMLSIGLFPNSPNKWAMFYEFKLMVFLSKLINHSPTSSTSVMASVLSSLGKANLRKDELNTCLSQWRLLEVEEMKVVRGELFRCPSCPGGGHCVHVDGNFKLYRYQHPGSSTDGLNVVKLDGFIGDDGDVQALVSQTRKCTDTDNVCGGTWKAASNQPGRKSGKIHETGLEIASCRHDLALGAINMHRGEIFAYPLYMQLQYPGATFIAMDVICKYWMWLEQQPSYSHLSSQQKPLLSIMHGFSHAWKCQYKWGARRQPGAGLSTGETTEHVNGYISRHGLTTRHMTKTRRHNRLTEAAAHWNSVKVAGLPKQLLSMKKKAEAKLSELESVTCWEELECKASLLALSPTTSDPLMTAVEVASANCLRLGQRVLKDGDSAKSRSRLRAKLRRAEQALRTSVSKLAAAHPVYKPDEVIDCSRSGVFPWMKTALNNASFDECCEAMELVDLRDRAREELEIVKVEHTAAVAYFVSLRDQAVVVPDHLQVTLESSEWLQSQRTEFCTTMLALFRVHTLNDLMLYPFEIQKLERLAANSHLLRRLAEERRLEAF